MSVRAGREFLAIPGPTTVPDEVLRAMHRPAVDIYSGPLLALTDSLMRDMARVFNTTGRAYIYIANGHGAWEAALTNVLVTGDKILVLESGRFAVGWGNNAARMGVEVEVLKGDMRRAVRPAEVEARLEGRQGRHHQGGAGGADRHRLGRGERHRGDRPGDPRRRPRRAADGRCGRLARLHAVRHGRLGRRRRDVGLAEGPDDAAGPRLRRRQRSRARGRTRRPGLRTPYWDWTDREGDAALPEIRRHAARASAVRPAPGARPAVRGRAGERLPPPPAARRGGAPRRRRLGGGPGRSASTSSSPASAATP